MSTESLQLTETFPAPPERVWRAWLDSHEHTEMTGAETSIQPAVGATFQASDGYIVGMNVELEPYHRIVQTWRTTEFPPGAPHSRLEIVLDEAAEGTRLTLHHSEIPEGQAERYREGWRDYYFMPMKDYFQAHGERKASSEIVDVAPVSSFEAQPVERAAQPTAAAMPRKNGTRVAVPVKKAASAAPAKAPAPSKVASAKAPAKVAAAKAPAKAKTPAKAAAEKKSAAPKKAAAAKKPAASKAAPAKQKAKATKAPARAASAKSKAGGKKPAAAPARGKKTAAKPSAGKKAAAKSKRG